MPLSPLYIIDILGTFSFAVSGTSAAIRKRLDVFGVLIIAFVTSVGGGTLRDVLIGNTPVGWLRNATTINVVLIATVTTIIFKTINKRFNYTLFLFDSLGLGLFTIIGIQKGIEMQFSPGICVALGTVTACFGGVARDILLNEIPVIFFKKEIYASACIVGGSIFYLLFFLQIPNAVAQSIGICIIVLIRIISVKYKLALPVLYNSKSEKM